METSILLLFTGLLIGFIGTLIGAGGGFILVPLLLLFYPEFTPEMVTSISMAVVCTNAISGSVAYARSGRIDYKAGIKFALFTIPGSIAGVAIVEYVSGKLFNILFGILMLALSGYLIFKREQKNDTSNFNPDNTKLVRHTIKDKSGVVYTYNYRELYGNIISIIVGFISPVLGIGGGIIHVPAMTNWLKFPVHIATATSHFILAIMATVTVITHAYRGTYNNPVVVSIVIFLAIGVIFGAQIGAYYSHKLKSNVIIKALAFCLGLVGLRILLQSF